jgi:hypothetical protein
MTATASSLPRNNKGQTLYPIPCLSGYATAKALREHEARCTRCARQS